MDVSFYVYLNVTGAGFHSALDEVENDLEPEFSLITRGFVPTKHSSLPEEGYLNVKELHSSCFTLSGVEGPRAAAMFTLHVTLPSFQCFSLLFFMSRRESAGGALEVFS